MPNPASAAAPRSAPAQPSTEAGSAHWLTFQELSPTAWDGLAAKAPWPMQRHIWVKAAVEQLHPGERVMVACVGPAAKPAALVALAQSRKVLARLSVPGTHKSGEPSDALHAAPEALHELARALSATRLPLDLGAVPAGSPLIGALKAAYGNGGLVVALTRKGTPYIDLDATWCKPEEKFNAGRRSDLRRMRRTAEKIGPVSVEILSPTANDVDRLLDEAFRIEAESWKGEAGTALARDASHGAFFRQYAADAARAGILRIAFLRIGGTAVATQIAIETGGGFWLLKIGYDNAYRRCSPGNLLMLETLRHAAERGLATYEFLGSEAEWTKAWAEAVRPMVFLRSYPASLSGLAALVEDCARYGWPLVRRMLRGLRQRLQTDPVAPAQDMNRPG